VQLQLDRRWIDKLARLPESGMGYQRVRVRLKGGHTIEEALVFNASVLQLADDTDPFDPREITDIQVLERSAR